MLLLQELKLNSSDQNICLPPSNTGAHSGKLLVDLTCRTTPLYSFPKSEWLDNSKQTIELQTDGLPIRIPHDLGMV